MNAIVQKLIQALQADERVLAVLLYGSHARGQAEPTSDIDLCVVLFPESNTPENRENVRLRYLSNEKIDLRIFQALPLYIRSRVLKEGEVLACKNLDTLYELAYRTAQAFEDFKPHYRQYLEQVAHG